MKIIRVIISPCLQLLAGRLLLREPPPLLRQGLSVLLAALTFKAWTARRAGGGYLSIYLSIYIYIYIYISYLLAATYAYLHVLDCLTYVSINIMIVISIIISSSSIMNIIIIIIIIISISIFIIIIVIMLYIVTIITITALFICLGGLLALLVLLAHVGEAGGRAAAGGR